MNVLSTRELDRVLVVGGGLVGLTAALVLRHHGVAVTLVERRAVTSAQPKARRFHTRTMEIFRELGIAGLVHEAGRELAEHYHMAAGRTLAEAEQLPLWLPSDAEGNHVEPGPEQPSLIAQDVLEPVLRRAAVDAGADIRFRTALTGFTAGADRVVTDLHDLADDRRERVAVPYVVAADGARSPVRERLGIGRSGRGTVGDPVVSVYFRTDLSDVVRGREFNLCQIQHPDGPGSLATVDGRARWVFMAAGSDTDRDWPRVLRTALGVPVPDLEVLSVLAWQPEMLVADRYSAGRVHLAGDAAHVMPPFAASGANTGVADVHNLGWKLAAVLADTAAPALLDSYDAERRPAGWFAAEQSSLRSGDLTQVPDPALAHPFVLAGGGFQYPSGALVGGSSEGGEIEPVTEYAPAGRVGTRVPHRWLDAGRARSTVDLAGPGWALLVAGDPARWERDAACAPAPLPVHRLDPDFLPAGTALLLRPDQVVAWRGEDPAAPAHVLRTLLAGAPSPVDVG